MGVNTKAIIRKGTTLTEIAEHIEKKYGEIEIRSTHSANYFTISFMDGKDHREMSVFFGSYGSRDYKIDGVLLDLNLWGNSVEIMKYLLNEFGGYIDECDSDDKDFYPVNMEAFVKTKELTAKDVFVNKVIAELGYDKLHKALELFEEYKALPTTLTPPFAPA